MPNDALNNLLLEVWTREKRRFLHPGIVDVQMVDSLDGENTAQFSWETHKVSIAREFAASMIKKVGGPNAERTILEAIVRHETGHWTEFPHDLALRLCILTAATETWKENGEIVYRFYADLVDEARLIYHGLAGRELVQMRHCLAKTCADPVSKGINEFLAMFEKSVRPDLADYKIKPSEIAAQLSVALKELAGFMPWDSYSPDKHAAALHYFGSAIAPLMTKHKILILMPPIPGECNKGPNPGTGNHGIEDVPGNLLLQALMSIPASVNPWWYSRVRKFLVSSGRLKEDAPCKPAESRRSNGIGGPDENPIARNDSLIPMYRAWAEGIGIFVPRKPMLVDESIPIRGGFRDFQPGDPLYRVGVYASRGIIGVPGLTKVYEDEPELVPAQKWIMPALQIGIDSSGSMAHPNSPFGAPQVLAGYILALNYWENGAEIGAWNFSGDLTWEPPTRNIESVLSLLTAYYGGGTHVDLKKLVQHARSFKKYTKAELRAIVKDPESELAKMSEEERQKYIEKQLHIDIERIKTTYEKLDNVIITDGGIANIEDVIGYLSTLGKFTRNFIFVTCPCALPEFQKLQLPNTYVHDATSKEKLYNLALTRVKDFAHEKGQYARQV